MAKIIKDLNGFIKHVYSEYKSELPDNDVMNVILIEFYLMINKDEKLNIFYPESTSISNVFMHFVESYKEGEIMRVYNERIK